MAPGLGEPHQLPIIKDGRDKHHVWRMGHAAAGAVAVVVPVEVAWPHRLGGILLQNSIKEVATERQVGAKEHPPIAREEGGKVVLLLTDKGRHGGAFDEG